MRPADTRSEKRTRRMLAPPCRRVRRGAGAATIASSLPVVATVPPGDSQVGSDLEAAGRHASGDDSHSSSHAAGES